MRLLSALKESRASMPNPLVTGCPGYNTPTCGRPSRRPNGISEGSQYCETCRSRWYYAKRKAENPDFPEQHLSRVLAWQGRNRAKARAYTNASYRRQKAQLLAVVKQMSVKRLRSVVSAYQPNKVTRSISVEGS